VAVDVSAIDPLLDTLNKLFAGSELAREKLEVWTLLRDIAREHAAGNLTDAETKMYANDIAKRTAALLARVGKPVAVDVLAEQLYAAIITVSSQSVGGLAFDIRRKMRSKREKARVRSEIESLL